MTPKLTDVRIQLDARHLDYVETFGITKGCKTIEEAAKLVVVEHFKKSSVNLVTEPQCEHEHQEQPKSAAA